MSDTNGCKTVLLVVVVAVIMGSMGFAAGFATHALLVATDQHEVSMTGVQDTVEPDRAESETPANSSEDHTESQPAPTIAIPEGTGATFDLFWEAWELIQRDYYGDLPNEDQFTYGAIRGALDTLDDPFTGFIEPRVAELNRQDDTGSFEGIGAYVSMEDGRLRIVSTFKDQPAEKAGLRRGDIVLQVDSTPIENMSIYEAITLIRGPAGSSMTMTILRAGEEPFEVEVVRAEIEIPVVEAEMRDDGIAYISLFEFSSDASAKLANEIKTLLDQDPSGLVLDLRGNPGGWLNESILVSNLFLPKDQVVVIERYKDAEPEELRTPGRPLVTEIPMVVLVDAGSASASEIVAGALQDYDRAVLVGETTFGKGSVQWPHELSNGAELRVTVARWFTPNDRAIHGTGLEPDITVELTEEDFEAGLDPQLDRAVQYLLTGE